MLRNAACKKSRIKIAMNTTNVIFIYLIGAVLIAALDIGCSASSSEEAGGLRLSIHHINFILSRGCGNKLSI